MRSAALEKSVRARLAAGFVPAVLVLWSVTVAGAAQRQVLRGHVPAAAARSQFVERLAPARHLALTIALPLRNRESLTNLLQQLYNPASPNYRRYLTPEQFAAQFGPRESDYQAVIAFAKLHGLTVTGTHPNCTLLDVSATVGSIEKALQVTLRVYRHPREARTFHAPDVEPSLELAVPILAIGGLDDFVRPRPMGLRTNSFRKKLDAVPYITGSGPRGNFIGKDFRAAYAPGVGLDGTGQSVGLVELDGYYAGDITAYENLAGLPNVPLTNVFLNGLNGEPGGNNIEVALDICMAISMAPGLSSVIVYAGHAANDILNRMATDNAARQLSCSWGFGPQVDPARQQIFQQFAAQGQSFFQASGDLGAWAGAVSPPSDDPWVTVVGGTALTTGSADGSWLSEATWPASGGGTSTSYAIPIWQQGVSMAANQGSTAMRNIPDVACLGDDAIWVIVNNGEQGVVGGTSAAAPLWAGFTALVNQQAAASGQPPVGFVNPAIYAIAQGPDYLSVFHDITTGNNTNDSSPNKFFAVAGYDLCTGWGTPTGSNLIQALLAPADPLRISPQTDVSFRGPVGGPFSPAAQNYLLTNGGATSLNWRLANDAPWLSVSPASGALAVGGPVATVTGTLTSIASNRSVGSYAASVWFTNRNDGFGQRRQMTLEVMALPVIAAQPASQAVFEGMTATFSVGTSSNAALSFQ
ncbi:MAG TPA: S53 family peptidase [Candidatus Binatia bacterium]|nr:S53 family peptidase [Candidatus Binatia bacterium]